MTEIHRRTALRFLGAGAAACPLCAGIAGALAAEAKGAAGQVAAHPHWSYEGAGAPEHWGRLEPQFRVCDLGLEQTPIDLKGAVKAELSGVAPAFAEMPLTIVNNGHTVQVNCPPGSHTVIAGERFELLQFHFHGPSEHTINGKRFAMENHFVHRSASGRLAVLGVFINEGAPHAALEPVFAAFPEREGPARATGATLRPAAMLPTERGYFRYAGSLTTPPCSEGVLWTVFKEPIEASSAQIRRFAALFPDNARPVQAVHRRFLLESR